MYADEIYKQCIELGIDICKVIFLYNNCHMIDINKDYEFIERILGAEFTNIIKERYRLIRGVQNFDNLCLEKADLEGYVYGQSDYVRIKSFDLAVKEISKRNVSGNVAEVGVFRGEFAQYINYAFPDRKCYLFDTFDGFNNEEAIKEFNEGNCSKAFIEAYSKTNVGMVMKKMKKINNVIIKQGLFPDSLDGLDDIFAFVSIDVDFEKSIYECLEYFYPRLSEGGYIFVHDYNSDLRGVERAIDKYELNENIRLCKVPLCDANGTLVITK